MNSKILPVPSQLVYAFDDDEHQPQDIIDRDARANLEFHVGPAASPVTLSEGPWWVEADVDPHDGLRIVYLLCTARFLGGGAITGTLTREDSTEPATQRWRIDLDPSTITGPPTTSVADLRAADRGRSPGGTLEVSVEREDDGRARTITLLVCQERAVREPYAQK